MSQVVCLYIQTPFLLRKMLVGNTQTRELHPLDAGCNLQITIGNSFVSIIVFFIPFPDWTKDAARIADSNNICRNILCNNAASPNDGIIANGYTGNNDHACTQPAVTPDMNGEIILECFFSQFRENGMVGSRENAIRTEHRVFTDINMCIIHTGQPEVGIYAIA